MHWDRGWFLPGLFLALSCRSEGEEEEEEEEAKDVLDVWSTAT